MNRKRFLKIMGLGSGLLLATPLTILKASNSKEDKANNISYYKQAIGTEKEDSNVVFDQVTEYLFENTNLEEVSKERAKQELEDIFLSGSKDTPVYITRIQTRDSGIQSVFHFYKVDLNTFDPTDGQIVYQGETKGAKSVRRTYPITLHPDDLNELTRGLEKAIENPDKESPSMVTDIEKAHGSKYGEVALESIYADFSRHLFQDNSAKVRQLAREKDLQQIAKEYELSPARVPENEKKAQYTAHLELRERGPHTYGLKLEILDNENNEIAYRNSIIAPSLRISMDLEKRNYQELTEDMSL